MRVRVDEPGEIELPLAPEEMVSAVAEDVVIGCFITALVMGSSADRGSCATAPEYQPLDANASVRAAPTDACLTHRMVASVVGSVGER